ncbi:5-formyltetrahydrofolate cyclo-ligase [uncultured Jatrophihabitans sp.]|uniref:5-formyltetrahydrofolate cyclo-ligase n=1 Tax=uncultured Jatrophihabitans sp. TaxID=1610747 RepID=UPI0035CB9476
MTSSDEAKTAARARFGAARRERSAADRATSRARICAHALDMVDATPGRCVAAYEPLPTEPGSVELLAAVVNRGSRVLVPHTLPDRDLDWREWSPTSAAVLLGKAAIGDADLILVPALAVARDGTRLGRGGGSYDRALERRSAPARVWALIFDEEFVDTLPADRWDVPVDGVIMPSGAVAVAGNGDVRRRR